ncbi:hypothetical protein GCM10022222_29810 [Amycolatopsis ultiminotia]|uniref:Uncharacterized protein n=1 Tax=Amycolatopsis ultiminotia TaxID=543629 RepID=A0ABP6W137_9PSEU
MQARAVGHDQHRPGVAEYESHAFGRIVRVHRQIHRTRLEHRQQAHHDLGRAGQQHRHRLFRTGATGDQLVREAVRPLVQLAVGQLVLVVDQRGCVRGSHDLSFEDRRCGFRTQSDLPAGPQRASLLFSGQHLDRREATVRCGGHFRQ